MLHGKLFIGVEVSEGIEKELKKTDPSYIDLYLNSPNQAYLHKIHRKNKSYIGKSLESVVDLPAIELLQLNVLSLLKQLMPNYSIPASSVCLISYLEK